MMLSKYTIGRTSGKPEESTDTIIAKIIVMAPRAITNPIYFASLATGELGKGGCLKI